MLFPKLAVIIIFQEVPLAETADKWISNSLIIPIFKNAHSGKQTEKILTPIRVYSQSQASCYQVGRLWR